MRSMEEKIKNKMEEVKKMLKAELMELRKILKILREFIRDKEYYAAYYASIDLKKNIETIRENLFLLGELSILLIEKYENRD